MGAAPSGKLDETETKAALQACHDGVFAWSNAIDHLCTHYQGKSLHNEIPDPTQFVDTYIPDLQRAVWSTNLTDNIWTITTTMDTNDKEYITLVSNVQRQAFDQLERYIHTLPIRGQMLKIPSHGKNLVQTTRGQETRSTKSCGQNKEPHFC
jgi:hypothetical protein